MAPEPLRFGPLTGRCIHLCVDMQNLFAEETPSIILYRPHYHLVTTERVDIAAPGPLNRPADRYRTIVQWTIDPEKADA